MEDQDPHLPVFFIFNKLVDTPGYSGRSSRIGQDVFSVDEEDLSKIAGDLEGN